MSMCISNSASGLQVAPDVSPLTAIDWADDVLKTDLRRTARGLNADHLWIPFWISFVSEHQHLIFELL
jgi:hypothetical protein